MAFKSLKQRWLQQFQEQQQDHSERLKSASSTHGGETTAHISIPAAETASKATPSQREEQLGKPCASQIVDREHIQPHRLDGRPIKKKFKASTVQSGLASESFAKHKHERGTLVSDHPSHQQGAAAKLSSVALQPKPRQQQQPSKDGALKHTRRDTSSATPSDPKPRKQTTERPQVKSEGFAARNEVASAGSNPSTSATKDREALQEAVSVQQHHRVKIEEHSAASGPVPVEVEPRPSAKPQQLGDIVPSAHSSYEELIGALQSAFGERLPKKAGLRLVYQDIDGDWLLLLPDVPWPLFLSTVRRLLITYK